MITFRNVSKIYRNGTKALDSVNFEIEPAEFVSIVGQSGTGKTTIVKLMSAEERATSGEVIIGGWNITRIPRSEVPFLRRQIGVIHQDFKLLQKKTIFENIAFALEVCGASRRRIRSVVPQVLKVVGLEGTVNRYPNQLSGGEQQRVAIARALVHRPKILMADEPTGNLDTINTKEIVDLLIRINEFGTTIVLVTHNSNIVNALKRRVITLKNSKIISDEAQGKYAL
jgi:cell division transport system ATP-binding protein